MKSGGGDGTFDAMDHRLEFLEKSFQKMDGKLDVLASDVSSLKQDVSSVKGDLASLKGTCPL